MSNTSSTQGGKREGAGRPRQAAALASDDALVERKLKSNASMGFEVLADSYVDLMRKAVGMAMGSEDVKPDKGVMKTLLELMIKVVGTEPNQGETPMSRILEKYLDRFSKDLGTEDGPTVARDSRGSDVTLDSRDASRSAAHSTVPGVELGLRISGDD